MPDAAPSETEHSARIDRTARQIVSQLGFLRLAGTIIILALALLLARFSWDVPLLRDAERALYDIRVANFAPQVPQDDRIVMVVYTDQTLRDTGQRSPVDRTILANALQNIDAMGPKAIGIDILFDQPQDDDPLLQDTFRNMRTPTHVAYASVDTNAEAIRFEQQEFLEGYLAEISGGNTEPTSIRLETDSDNVIRSWPSIPPELPPFFSIALAGGANGLEGYRGPIRFRAPEAIDRPVFAKFPIDLFADPETAEFMADQIAGRHVLIGGDFVDFDQFDTPFTRTGDPVTGATKMIGLEVHAHILAQLLDGYRPATVPSWIKWGAALLVVFNGALTALLNVRPWMTGILLVGQMLLFVALPFGLEALDIHTLGLPSFGWAIGWLIAYSTISAAARTVGSKQRAFAQGALGKYLPKSVASEIIKDPEKLALHGEKREIFCVFSDLEGFTKLSHAVPPEMVAQLLNAYLDKLAAVVLEYGGTLDKFVGDAVVAFWGAPISFPDDGERAARAAYALYQAGEEFRRNRPKGVPPIGRTRVGMHFGEAIVGNFGGEGRIQYTAFGDSMNTAARLEAANKALDTKVLVSREAAERSGLDWYRPMGKITLRGRSTPVEVFEPMPEWEPQERAVLANILSAHAKGEGDAVALLTDIVAKWREDNALSNLHKRLQATAKGESYVLG